MSIKNESITFWSQQEAPTLHMKVSEPIKTEIQDLSHGHRSLSFNDTQSLFNDEDEYCLDEELFEFSLEGDAADILESNAKHHQQKQQQLQNTSTVTITADKKPQHLPPQPGRSSKKSTSHSKSNTSSSKNNNSNNNHKEQNVSSDRSRKNKSVVLDLDDTKVYEVAIEDYAKLRVLKRDNTIKTRDLCNSRIISNLVDPGELAYVKDDRRCTLNYDENYQREIIIPLSQCIHVDSLGVKGIEEPSSITFCTYKLNGFPSGLSQSPHLFVPLFVSHSKDTDPVTIAELQKLYSKLNSTDSSMEPIVGEMLLGSTQIKIKFRSGITRIICDAPVQRALCGCKAGFITNSMLMVQWVVVNRAEKQVHKRFKHLRFKHVQSFLSLPLILRPETIPDIFNYCNTKSEKDDSGLPIMFRCFANATTERFMHAQATRARKECQKISTSRLTQQQDGTKKWKKNDCDPDKLYAEWCDQNDYGYHKLQQFTKGVSYTSTDILHSQLNVTGVLNKGLTLFCKRLKIVTTQQLHDWFKACNANYIARRINTRKVHADINISMPGNIFKKEGNAIFEVLHKMKLYVQQSEHGHEEYYTFQRYYSLLYATVTVTLKTLEYCNREMIWEADADAKLVKLINAGQNVIWSICKYCPEWLHYYLFQNAVSLPVHTFENIKLSPMRYGPKSYSQEGAENCQNVKGKVYIGAHSNGRTFNVLRNTLRSAMISTVFGIHKKIPAMMESLYKALKTDIRRRETGDYMQSWNINDDFMSHSAPVTKEDDDLYDMFQDTCYGIKKEQKHKPTVVEFDLRHSQLPPDFHDITDMLQQQKLSIDVETDDDDMSSCAISVHSSEFSADDDDQKDREEDAVQGELNKNTNKKPMISGSKRPLPP